MADKNEVTSVNVLIEEINKEYDKYKNGMIRMGEFLRVVKKHVDTVTAYELAEYERCINTFGYRIVKVKENE